MVTFDGAHVAILVIEGGRPDGGDLVVGEHHFNGLSKAKASGQQIVKVADLGDGFALAGVGLMPVFDADGKDLCVLLVANAGRNSALVGLQAVPIMIAELGRIPIAELKTSIASALDGPKEEAAQ